MLRLFISLYFIFFFSSCSLIHKSQQARSTNKDIKASEPRTQTQSDKPRVLITRSTVDPQGNPLPSSRSDEDDSISSPDSAKAHVNKLERRLESENEKQQYARVLPLFKNDLEKIEFLTLPTVVSRQEWINEKKILKRSTSVTPEMRRAVENQDITMEMPMDLVKKAWGEPASIEVSGNPIYKNEKWRYIKFVSTSGGYKAEKRIVYFENGKVSGWETE